MSESRSSRFLPSAIPYLNYRALVTLLLGFSSGLPAVLIGSTMQAWYTKSGVSIMTVGVLSFVGMPYTWKFLVAPFCDRYTPFKLGRRRSWILLCQIAIAMTLVLIAYQSPARHPLFLGVLALIAALFSALQDVSIDAYRTDLLSEDERGMGAAMVSLGYRIAMLVAGALALLMAYELGWRLTYLSMAVCMSVCIVVTLFSPKPPSITNQPSHLHDAIFQPFMNVMRRPFAGLILVFIVTYKLTDALALSLNSYFLLHFLKFTLIELGAVTKVSGMLGVILGSLVGGACYSRFGLYRALLYFGLLQAVSALFFILLLFSGKNISVMAMTIFIENFCSGLSTVAFVVYLTSLCNKRYTATQYALFSAVMSLGRVYIGPVAAVLVMHYGWLDFYVISFLVGLIPLMLLYFFKEKLIA